MTSEQAKDTPKHHFSSREQSWASGYNLLFIAVIFIGAIVSTGWGYIYREKEQEVSRALKALQALHTRNLFLSAERINRERLEHIEAQIQELQLPLVRSTEPPFLLVDTLQKEDKK